MNRCTRCGTSHPEDRRCPEGLEALEIERHTWRVNCDTADGIVAVGVLVAPCEAGWRARILTYPNVLWLVPGGDISLKFVAAGPREAERAAVDFVRTHCRRRRWLMRDEIAVVPAGAGPTLPRTLDPPPGAPAPRRIRYLPVRFGVDAFSETGGTGDLSETGMFVITDRPLDSGTWLRMQLNVENEAIPLRAMVRWRRSTHRVGRAPGMGVQLHDPPEGYVDYVRTLS